MIGEETDYEWLPTGFEEKSVEPDKKARFRTLSLRFWKSKETKDNRYSPDTNKRDLSTKSDTCHPPPHINYEEINFNSPPKDIPTDKPQITSNSRLKPYLELPTKKPSPSLQYPPKPVFTPVRKVFTPMRRTISHSAVHSHKHTILAPEFQDMIPEPPKRDQSLGVKVTRQPIPSPVQPKKTKAKPNNEENYHTETNPTHRATQNYIPNNKNTLPKIPPKTKSLGLRRSDSTPSKIRTTEQTNHNLKDRAKSIRRPPAVLIKPKLSRSTTKELIEEKSTAGEGKERTIQDLESHLKEFKIIRSIESKSQLRMQNFYQESPSKVVN